jgi:hypothetical protein
MPTDLPLSIVISQVLQHTPIWVWFVLCGITAVGLRQVADRVVTSRRLAITPVALGAYSLWGAVAAFGPHAEVLVAWVMGVALAVVANHWLAWPRQVEYQGDGRYAVQGSIWPLLSMWSVFAVRYVTTVTLVMHPGWAHGTTFSLLMPAVYGALSGLFLARSLRILRSGSASNRLQMA